MVKVGADSLKKFNEPKSNNGGNLEDFIDVDSDGTGWVKQRDPKTSNNLSSKLKKLNKNDMTFVIGYNANCWTTLRIRRDINCVARIR